MHLREVVEIRTARSSAGCLSIGTANGNWMFSSPLPALSGPGSRFSFAEMRDWKNGNALLCKEQRAWGQLCAVSDAA